MAQTLANLMLKQVAQEHASHILTIPKDADFTSWAPLPVLMTLTAKFLFLASYWNFP